MSDLRRWTISRRTAGPIRATLTKQPAHVHVDGPDTAKIEVVPAAALKEQTELLEKVERERDVVESLWADQKEAADEYATELANIRMLFDGAPTEALALVRDLKSRAEDRKERLEEEREISKRRWLVSEEHRFDAEHWEKRGREAEASLSELREALRWTLNQATRVLEGKPVRNWDETVVAAESALAIKDEAGSGERCERCGGEGTIRGRHPDWCNCIYPAHCYGGGSLRCRGERFGTCGESGPGVAAGPTADQPCPRCHGTGTNPTNREQEAD